MDEGRFADATPQEKAQSEQVRAWLMTGYRSDLAEIWVELRASGIADPKMNNATIRDVLWAQVGSAPGVDHWASFAAFQRAVEKAAPITDT